MEEIWIEIQKSVVEFENYSDADIKDYFKDKFLPKTNELVTNYLSDKNIEIVLSSPYKRALDAVKLVMTTLFLLII